MKYFVHLPVVHFARFGVSRGYVLDHDDSAKIGDQKIYSIFRAQFSDQCVPRVGESFPVAAVGGDRFCYTKKVVDVTRHFNGQERIRIPVVVLEPQYFGTVLSPEQGMVDVTLANWGRVVVHEVTTCRGISADIRILRDGGYTLWYGPRDEPLDPLVFDVRNR